MDYLNYWGIVSSPFRLSKESQLYFGEAHRVFLADLIQVASQPQRITSFLAPRHSGLSTLLGFFADSHGLGKQAVQMAVVGKDLYQKDCLLRVLMTAIGASGISGQHQAVCSAADKIALDHLAGIRSVLVLDRPLASAMEVAIELAGNCQQLHVLIAGDSEVLDLVPSRVHQGNKIDLKSSLGCLSYAESLEFIRSSLREVGGADDVFSVSALDALFLCAGGRIGLISHLAYQSMQQAFEFRIRQVTLEVLESVLHTPVRQAA